MIKMPIKLYRPEKRYMDIIPFRDFAFVTPSHALPITKKVIE